MAMISLKCGDQEKQAFQDYCESKGVSVSAELRRLMNQASGSTPEKIDINTLSERVKALEAKFKSLNSSGVHIEDSTPYKTKKAPSEIGRDPGELITIDEASEVTGYAVATLRSKLSRKGVQAVRRIDGNRGGLYSKAEILEKVGLNK